MLLPSIVVPISHFIVIITVVCSQIGYTKHQELPTEDFLCRMCGEDISKLKYVHNRLSPESISVKNHTDFGNNDIYVQVLENPLGIRFGLMTFFKASCLQQGSWHTEGSWFPGFAWKVCLCPRCHKHIGWRFEPTLPAESTPDKEATKGFYGLVADKLISPKAANSIIARLEL